MGEIKERQNKRWRKSTFLKRMNGGVEAVSHRSSFHPLLTTERTQIERKHTATHRRV